MSPFESFLSGQFEDYIAYRHQLGYDTKGLQWVLRTLDRHLLKKKAEPADLTLGLFPHPAGRSAGPVQIRQPSAVHHPHVL